jgi:hypothetical protein
LLSVGAASRPRVDIGNVSVSAQTRKRRRSGEVQPRKPLTNAVAMS